MLMNDNPDIGVRELGQAIVMATKKTISESSAQNLYNATKAKLQQSTITCSITDERKKQPQPA